MSPFSIADPQQVQPVNYTLELRTDNTTYFVGDTATFQGHLGPGRVARILLTITITDGSQETRFVSSNSTGDFDFEYYLASAGPYSAYAQLVDPSINSSMTSNSVGFLVSYLPMTNTTVTSSTTVSSSTTSSANGTKAATAGGRLPSWLLPLLALVMGLILALVVLVQIIKRTKPFGRPSSE